MLQSFPPVAKVVPFLLKSSELIVFYYSRRANIFLSEGTCQY